MERGVVRVGGREEQPGNIPANQLKKKTSKNKIKIKIEDKCGDGL